MSKIKKYTIDEDIPKGNSCAEEPCHHTWETGKHEWNTLTSTGSECGIGYDFCSSCHWVDIRGTIKRASLIKLLKVHFS